MKNQSNSIGNQVEGMLEYEQPLYDGTDVKKQNLLTVWLEKLNWKGINIEVELKDIDGKRDFLDDLYFEIKFSISEK